MHSSQDMQNVPLQKATNRILLIWLFAPGLPYLANKLLLKYRNGFFSDPNHSIVFGILVIVWFAFALFWIGWILRSSATWWTKLGIICPLLAVFRAATTLNYLAANGTLGEVRFP